jgi:hypothetical protein
MKRRRHLTYDRMLAEWVRAYMAAGMLYVSFWSIVLDNLPEGAFRRCSITPAHARRLFQSARKAKRLLCLSKDDLLAPYHKHKKKNCEELCKLLREDFGMEFVWEDFTSKDHPSKDGWYSVNPLNCVQVEGKNRLLVVSCNYVLPARRSRKKLEFQIAPDSVEFSLFEAIPDGG